MKTCQKCKENKNETEFYLNHRYKNGYSTTCKQCQINYGINYYKKYPEHNRIWRKNNPEKVKQYKIKHAEKQAEYYKKWYARNGRQRNKKQIECVLLWKKNNPEKMDVIHKFNYAVKKGLIEKPLTCIICNKESRLHGHHENYNKPYEIIWVCASCHRKIHENKKKYEENKA